MIQIIFSTDPLLALVNIIQGPDEIMSSFYDSFPSSYAGVSFRDQPDNEGGGKYAVYHAKQNEYSNRRVYYSYIDENGTVTNVAAIGTDDLDEGYPSLDIDPETGDPLVAWNTEDGIKFSYDMFHLGSPGLWKTPFFIFDENTASLHPDDFFLFPLVEVGNSPVANKKRVYVVAKNTRTPNIGEQYVNAMLAYADFNESDFNMQLTLDWTYVPLQFSNLIYTDTIDPYHFTFTTADNGDLAIVGYSDEHEVFALINNNFGEGDFFRFSELYEFPVENPLNQNGTPRFVDDQGDPYNLYFAPNQSENTNAVFTCDDDKVIFPVSFALMAEPSISFNDDCLLYPKVITFSLDDSDFSFCDFHFRGDNPTDDSPMLPWDHNEDGVVDDYDENGNVTWLKCWPIYFPEQDSSYSINNYKISRNEELGISTILWSDGTKAKLASLGIPGYWQWEEVPEIAISVGSDWNPTWSDTDLLSSYAFDELENMIPAYIFPSSKIIDSGNDFYQLDLVFFDDFFYGPYASIPQPIPGGAINTMRVKVYYQYIPSPNLWVMYPNGGETLYIYNDYNVVWNFSGLNGQYDVQLLENDQFCCNLVEGTNTTNYFWTIPGNIEPGDFYSIKVIATNYGVSDVSDYFPIQYYFYVLYPIADVELIAGSTFVIDWATIGIEGPFNVELLDNDQFVLDIAENVNETQYVWAIPGDMEPGQNYSIRITDELQLISTISPGYFTILEPVLSDEILKFETKLNQNTPNPFNPTTTISFSISPKYANEVKLEIYNSKGQKVKTFSINPSTDQPINSVIWNGTDDSGKPVSSGVYLYKLNIGKKSLQKKMLLLK